MARKKRQIGLGDVVEKITTATGIKQLMPDDCGCDKRKEQLNALISFGQRIVNCPTDEQTVYINSIKNTISQEQRKVLADIYLSVYGQKIDAKSTCGDCWVKWLRDLNRAI